MTGYFAAFGLTALAAIFCGGCLSVLRRRRYGSRHGDSPTATIVESSTHLIPFPPRQAAASDTATVEGLSLREAEDMLDWLEQNDFRDCKLVCQADAAFSVEFRLKDTADREPPVMNPFISLQRYSVG
jgi:hypothetical protein